MSTPYWKSSIFTSIYTHISSTEESELQCQTNNQKKIIDTFFETHDLTVADANNSLDQKFESLVFQCSSKGKCYSTTEDRCLWCKQKTFLSMKNRVRAMLWPTISKGTPFRPHMSAVTLKIVNQIH